MTVRNYRDLKVWQKGVDLVVQCYQITEIFPRRERYGLVSQIRRAAVSIPANIAEGNGRDHLGDDLRHLSFASGSLKEVETQLWIANRLEFVDEPRLDEVLAGTAEVGRMLSGLKRSLRRRRRQPT